MSGIIPIKSQAAQTHKLILHDEKFIELIWEIPKILKKSILIAITVLLLLLLHFKISNINLVNNWYYTNSND